jgi:transcriptional regulator with XRE-family HTH domain
MEGDKKCYADQQIRYVSRLLPKVSSMKDPTFGRAIADARKNIGLTQKELAAKVLREDGCAISPQYLNDIERDRRSPSSDHIVQQFAQALELDADYLHYLNGRFPEPERQEKLTADQFKESMLAFRRTQSS